MTTETRAPGVRCPQCGAFLGEVIEGQTRFRCHGYDITVTRPAVIHSRQT